MGIHNLSKVIKAYGEKGIRTVSNSEMRGKILALDTSNILYQFLTAIRGSEMFSTKDGKSTVHIHAIIMKTINLTKRGIRPVYVFDGAPPSIKQETLDKRSEIKDKAKKKLLEESDEEMKKKLKQRSVYITDEEIEECKEVLRLMGVPYIEAPEEADAQCVYLVRKGICDGVGSEDMDMLTFGAKKLYRNINSKGEIVEYDLRVILEELELSREQFIDMCILLGCDYSPTIEGIGMKRAYNLIREYGLIEDIISLSKYKPSEEFMGRYEIARRYFKKAPVLGVEREHIEWKDVQSEELYRTLVERYEYGESNAKKYINCLSNVPDIKTKCSIYEEEDMFSD